MFQLFAKDPYQNIIDFIDVAIDTEQISSWLFALESVSQSQRLEHLARMQVQMENDHAPKEHIEIVKMMRNEKIFHAINSVIKDVQASGMRAGRFVKKTDNTHYKNLLALIAT